jgi:hypothetical protein
MLRATAVNVFLLFIAGLVTEQPSMAQDAPGEVSQYEASVSWLGLTPKGNVQTNSNRVDFGSDLGIDRMQSQVGFWFLANPWERNGIFVEFIPYRFDGELTLTRSFRFGGVTFPVNEPITATASLNFVSGGYHRTVLRRNHFDGGLLAGVGYMALRSDAVGPSVGEAEVDRDIVFPLVGFIGRYRPGTQSQFTIRGEIRGMTFGSYGSYLDVSGSVAFNLSPHIAIEAGYRVLDGDGHHKTRGADVNFHGPLITFRMHDR